MEGTVGSRCSSQAYSQWRGQLGPDVALRPIASGGDSWVLSYSQWRGQLGPDVVLLPIASGGDSWVLM